MVTAIIFIIVLAILILSHEFGHFIAAKKAGIRVDEFAFGFPPRLWSIKKGETEYSLNLFPIGGYVKIFGENPDEESETGPDARRSMVNKPRFVQAIVLVAGVALNLLLAWLLISANLSLGMPVAVGDIPKGVKVEKVSLLVTSVMADSPAEDAGLKAGDALLSLEAGNEIIEELSAEDVRNFLQGRGGEEVAVKIERTDRVAGEVAVLATTTIVRPAAGILTGQDGVNAGIGITMEKVGLANFGFFESIWHGLNFTAGLTVATLEGYKHFFTSLFTEGTSALTSVAGPIGLFGLVGDASRMGLVYLLNFIAIISINLAILNLLPFPALDGGRLLFLAIEAVKGSRLNPKIANALNAVGFLLLILLMVAVAASDIAKII